MCGVSDAVVERVLAVHSEQPRDVDEAMGIGKRAGDAIKAEARDLYERHNLGGQDRTYNRIPEEIRRPAEDALYTWIETKYPEFASRRYAAWRMARVWKSLARRRVRRRNKGQAYGDRLRGEPCTTSHQGDTPSNSQVSTTPEAPRGPSARSKGHFRPWE